MKGFNFTESLRRSLRFARASAEQLDSASVEPVHLLLGLSQVPGPTMTAALAELGVTVDRMLAAAGAPARSTIRLEDHAGADLPYTRAAKAVLEDAMRAAERLEADRVGGEHLLLGMLAPRSPLAAPLGAIGVSAAAFEAAVVAADVEEVVEVAGPDEVVPIRLGPQVTRRNPVGRLIAVVVVVLGAVALWFALTRA